MTDLNVPAESPVSEPSVWADIAAELRRVADEIETLLVAEPAPSSFQLNIQPHNADRIGKPTVKGRPATVAAVDAVSGALLGKDAETYSVSGGFHHGRHGGRGPVSLAIYTSVVSPDAVDPDEEIAQLRAENERLRAALPGDPTGQSYSRADDGELPQPSAGRVPAHLEDGVTGAVIAVAGGHVVHECCGKLDDAPHANYCEHRRPEVHGLTPIHFGFLHVGTACGLAAEGADRRSQVSNWAGVTCEQCLTQAPASDD